MITFKTRDGGWEAIPKPTRKKKEKNLSVRKILKRWEKESKKGTRIKVHGGPSDIRIIGLPTQTPGPIQITFNYTPKEKGERV